MKKLILTVLFLSCIFLISCSGEADSTAQNTDNNLTEQSANNTSDDLTEYSADKVSNDLTEYLAGQTDGSMHIVQDYDTVISLCSDAIMEFVRAVADQDNADMNPYIENALLKEYMQYRVEHHNFQYVREDTHRFLIEEIRFQDEYALIKGVLAVYSGVDSYSLDGETSFLVKNLNGRFFIVDWYWDAMDSPDVLWRGVFSADRNLTYWEDDAQCGNIIKKIREE